MTEEYVGNYDKLEPRKITRWLDKMYREAVVSPDLKRALREARDAMKAKDYQLAEEVTAVKSYVVGEIDPSDTRDHFQEDGEENRRLFGGETVYDILDAMTHELSFYLMSQGREVIPAGAVVIGRTESGRIRAQGRNDPGVSDRLEPEGSSVTLRLMQAEHDVIVEEARHG